MQALGTLGHFHGSLNISNQKVLNAMPRELTPDTHFFCHGIVRCLVGDGSFAPAAGGPADFCNDPLHLRIDVAWSGPAIPRIDRQVDNRVASVDEIKATV
jgi:hypothetical protein